MTKRLTARQLGITPEERRALIKVRDGLAAGEYLHRRIEHSNLPDPGRPIFNMSTWRGEEGFCGTAGCIGGWMERVGAALAPLFMPSYKDTGSWDGLTTRRAAKAIDRFLETGTNRPWARRAPAAA